MCFSATVSFASGAALSAAGLYCVVRAARRCRPHLGLALIPLLFGAQQFAEGVVWHGLEHGHEGETLLGARMYLSFAMWLWPSFIPVAISFVERVPRRRTILRVIGALGAGYGMSLYLPVLFGIPGGEIIEITAREGSISYYTNTLIEPAFISNVFYILFSPCTLVTTTHKPMQMFAFLLFLSAVVTRFFYVNTWTSMWCFIAALLSAYLVRFILRAEPQAADA